MVKIYDFVRSHYIFFKYFPMFCELYIAKTLYDIPRAMYISSSQERKFLRTKYPKKQYGSIVHSTIKDKKVFKDFLKFISSFLQFQSF